MATPQDRPYPNEEQTAEVLAKIRATGRSGEDANLEPRLEVAMR